MFPFDPSDPMKDFIDESLDEKQQEAVEAVYNGEDVFITGGAGTGKSRTLNAIVCKLREKFGEDFKDKVAVTATTGTAAINVGGCTLHHITGLKVPQEVKDFKCVGKGVYKKVWQNLEVLVIDEASMLSGEFFERLNTELKRVRESKPLQLVLVGDLFQLPPITNRLEAEVYSELDPEFLKEGLAVKNQSGCRKKHIEYFLNRGMIFQCATFWDLDFRFIELTTQHRQRRDATLAMHLRSLRNGPDEGAVRKINKRCYRPLEAQEEASQKETVRLVPTKERVDAINHKRLAALAGKEKVFRAKDCVVVGGAPPENLTVEEREQWIRGAEEALKMNPFFQGNEVPPAVSLKVGALVMLSSTIDPRRDLVNGQSGHVVELRPRSVFVYFEGLERRVEIPFYKFRSTIPGLGECIREQIPLRLAWAITHHRSQGKTLNHVEVDPECFACGQAYVALSRVRRMQDLRLQRPVRMSDIRTNPAVLAFVRLQSDGAKPEEAVEELKTWRQLPVPKRRRSRAT